MLKLFHMRGNDMDSWKNLILENMEKHKDTWDEVEYCTISHKDLTKRFDSGFGLPRGKLFILWTKSRVYFPIVYDGSEWVESVPRNPRDEVPDYFGGF